MGLALKQSLEPEGVLGVWHIQEPESFFLEKMELFPAEREEFGGLRGAGRRLEWLATRYLLHLLSERTHRGALIKDEFGKPHLEGSDWHISISHSNHLAAVIAAPAVVGVDIQRFVPRIGSIAHKFMHPLELKAAREDDYLAQLHVYWGAKESLYKAYGRRQLTFSEDLFIHPFRFQPQGGHTFGTLKKNGRLRAFRIVYSLLEESFFLVHAMETDAHPPR